jgi:hypothetical protein
MDRMIARHRAAVRSIRDIGTGTTAKLARAERFSGDSGHLALRKRPDFWHFEIFYVPKYVVLS